MITTPRALAVRFLEDLFRPGKRVDELTQDPDFLKIDRRDRRLVTQLVYGVLRNRSRLDCYLAQLSETPLHRLDVPVLWILRSALYQLEFLRIPDPAAVHEAVALCRQSGNSAASGFVNAVLRGFLRKRPSLPKGVSPQALAVRYSHPEWLVRRYWERYGRVGTKALLERNNQPPVPSTWVNVFKIELHRLCRELDREGVSYEVYPDLPNCLIIRSPNLPQSEFYRQGLCFLMDVGSQEIANLPRLEGLRLLGDFCAAPGGKSFLMASRKESDARLFCCDLSADRLRVTRERARLYQVPDLSFVRVDLTSPVPFQNRFDFVLLDVPCSGLGTLRSNPDIRWKIQPSQLTRFHSRQLAMLRNGFAVLRRGGELLYCTCSTEPEENEQVIDEFLAREANAVLIGGLHRTFPHSHPGECFFAARIRHASRGYGRVSPH